MMYFSDKMPKGRVPNREYFFNVLNTLEHEYCQKLISHAGEMRNSVKNEAQAQQQIEISDEWWDRLQSVPFISSKLSNLINAVYRAEGTDPASTEGRISAIDKGEKAQKNRNRGDTSAVPPDARGAEVGGEGRRDHAAEIWG